MPEISVIVPVYKAEDYLHACVDSILSQTVSDFELILVDDGSPDGCGTICDDYAARDSRVRVIHQENQGQAAARNRALAVAKGEWVCFVDSDDAVHPRMLERLGQAAAESGAAMSMCRMLEAPEMPEDFYWNNWIHSCKFLPHRFLCWSELYLKRQSFPNTSLAIFDILSLISTLALYIGIQDSIP